MIWLTDILPVWRYSVSTDDPEQQIREVLRAGWSEHQQSFVVISFDVNPPVATVEDLPGPSAFNTRSEGITLTETPASRLSSLFGESPAWGYLVNKMKSWASYHYPDGILANRIDPDDWQAWAKDFLREAQAQVEYCDSCQSWACPYPNVEEDHLMCEHCDTLQQRTQFDDIEVYFDCVYDRNPTSYRMCRNCAAHVVELIEIDTCQSHGRYILTEHVFIGNDDYPYCETAWSDRWSNCDECGNTERRDDLTEHEGEWFCEGCADTLGLFRGIREWDYRPQLVFHPPTPINPKKPLYIGLEVEVSFDGSGYYIQDWLDDDRFRDLVYAKQDGSVENGCEFVTHPMQPAWALEHFPFDKFDQLITNHKARETHPTCGTHIHMNKEAFTTSHMWKFLQVHFRLPNFCKLVGGREDGTYASFSRADVQVQRQKLMNIVKRKDEAIHDYDRYVAVNLRNEYTIELRYPAGGTSSRSIRKNIEWAQALYDFTDYLTVEDVREGALDNPGYLLWWIQKGGYPALTTYIQDRMPHPVALKERSA